MKKTIIITIAMLCVFGAVVMFGADRVSTDWQKPSEDDVEISSTSPVEQVENEFKIYNYVLSDSKSMTYKDLWEYDTSYYSEPEKDMLTYMQAASYGGTFIEQNFSWIDIGEEPLYVALWNYNSKDMFHITYRKEGDKELNTYNHATCRLDAYTGELYAVFVDNGSGSMIEVLKLDRQYGQTNIESETLKEKVLTSAYNFSAEKGYCDINKYITRSVGEDYHEIYFTTGNDYVINIIIRFDEEDNLLKTHFSVDKNNIDVVEYINSIGESFVQEG